MNNLTRVMIRAVFVSIILTILSFGLAAKSQAPSRASLQGKYSKLIQVMPCEKDRNEYGEFKDWGYWKGGPWCGQIGKPGFWVYLAPNWYIWNKN